MVRPTAFMKQPGEYWVMIGSRLPALGVGPILFVVITPICGVVRNKYWMIGVAVATIPEGMVKGPEITLPKNS